jgi:hypothetical protein
MSLVRVVSTLIKLDSIMAVSTIEGVQICGELEIQELH